MNDIPEFQKGINDAKRILNVFKLAHDNISTGKVIFEEQESRTALYLKDNYFNASFRYSKISDETIIGQYIQFKSLSPTYFINKKDNRIKIDLQKSTDVIYKIEDVEFTEEWYFQKSLVHEDKILRKVICMAYLYNHLTVQYFSISETVIEQFEIELS